VKKRALQVPSSHQPAKRADAARHNNASDNSRESEVATQSSQNRPLASPARASSPSHEAEQARSGEEQAVLRHAESKVQVGVTSSEAPPSHPVVVFDNVEDDNTNPTDVTTSTAGETHTGASGDEVKRHSASGTPEQKNKKGTGEKAKRPKHINLLLTDPELKGKHKQLIEVIRRKLLKIADLEILGDPKRRRDVDRLLAEVHNHRVVEEKMRRRAKFVVSEDDEFSGDEEAGNTTISGTADAGNEAKGSTLNERAVEAQTREPPSPNSPVYTHTDDIEVTDDDVKSLDEPSLKAKRSKAWKLWRHT